MKSLAKNVEKTPETKFETTAGKRIMENIDQGTDVSSAHLSPKFRSSFEGRFSQRRALSSHAAFRVLVRHSHFLSEKVSDARQAYTVLGRVLADFVGDLCIIRLPQSSKEGSRTLAFAAGCHGAHPHPEAWELFEKHRSFSQLRLPLSHSSVLHERFHGDKDVSALLLLPLFPHSHDTGSLALTRVAGRPDFGWEEERLAHELVVRTAQQLLLLGLGPTNDKNSDQSHAEEALAARDNFLSVASHELKTPLTSLSLQLQMSQRALEKEKNRTLHCDRFYHALSVSHRQVKRLAGVIDDLIDVALIQGGRLRYNFENDVDLAAITREACQRSANCLQAAGCSLNLYLPKKLAVPCDPLRIQQVVHNLLSNAAKYAAGKRVEVRLNAAGDCAVLSVRDWGRGIPHEKHRLIFERFERAVSWNGVSGLGLGLFLVQQIVRAHNGLITLESSEGCGARFSVHLPLSQNQPSG